MFCLRKMFTAFAISMLLMFTNAQRGFLGDQKPVTVKVDITTSSEIAATNSRFLSVAIDANITAAKWAKLNLGSKKVQALAGGLSPCYLRCGGNSADFLIFSPEDSQHSKNEFSNSQSKSREVVTDTRLKFQSFETFEEDFGKRKDLKNFTFPAKYWDELNAFVKTVGFDLIFGLNALLRNSHGHWDPSNAAMLFNYTASKKYRIAGWELGNEPNDFKKYGKNITPADLAIDYTLLRYDVLQKFNLPGSSSFRFIGPSVTQLSRKSARTFFSEFLQKGGSYVVTAPTFHHYYVNAKNVSEQDFMDPKILDSLGAEIQTGNAISYFYGGNNKLWLGETGSCSGGGAKGLSDRYIAGFMWLDKLGLSASLGVDVVVRQSFYGGRYGLIDYDTSDPNPDYWLSFLYKTLVGPNVLKVTNNDKTGYVRTYAHCSTHNFYAPGSVTLFVMNMMNHTVTITSSMFGPQNVHVYLMEPGDKAGLQSQQVMLNGNLLQISSDNVLPDLTQYLLSMKGDIAWPAQTYGFIVIPNAKARACR